MKKNSGISMIELVIVMVILLIIATLAIFNGTNSIQKAEATELYEEMTNMKNAISGVILQRDLEGGNEAWLEEYYDESLGNDWYLIYGMGESGYETSNVREKLDMDTIKRNYMVNYETGEVMLSTSVEVFGNQIRTYDALRALVESEKI